MIVKGNNPNKPIGRIESQQPHFGRHPDLFLLHLEISHFCEDASLSDGPEPSGNTYQGTRIGVWACRCVGVGAVRPHQEKARKSMRLERHADTPTRRTPIRAPRVPRTLLIDNSILPLFHRGSE
jgi:hypothetical protein